MDNSVEVRVEIAESDADLIDLILQEDASHLFLRIPVERSTDLATAIDPAVIVLAWTGTTTMVGAAVSWLCRRLKRGVIIDARQSPIVVRKESALHRGQVVIVDASGKVAVHETEEAPSAVEAAAKLIHLI